MINKEKLMETVTFEEAFKLVFGRDLSGRVCIPTNEAMEGNVAEEYDSLGKTARQETYKRIAQDFKNRTDCYGGSHIRSGYSVGTILDVGCGSGLLSLELAAQTKGSIIGLDLSPDMIRLAYWNLAERSRQLKAEILEFHSSLPLYAKPTDEQLMEMFAKPPLKDRVTFVEGSAYDVKSILGIIDDLNYIVCRNVLHRLQNPKRAIEQMHSVLAPGGQIYIRDIRGDSDWDIIKKRIGKKRWQSEALIKDYLAAYSTCLTTSELEAFLQSLEIRNYEITDGSYLNCPTNSKSNLNEYEKETEYVCVIKKEV